MERELHRPFPHQPPFTAGNLLGVYGPAMTSKPDYCSETTLFISSSLPLSLFFSSAHSGNPFIQNQRKSEGTNNKTCFICCECSSVSASLLLQKDSRNQRGRFSTFQPFDCAVVEREDALILQSKSSSGEVVFSYYQNAVSRGQRRIRCIPANPGGHCSVL